MSSDLRILFAQLASSNRRPMPAAPFFTGRKEEWPIFSRQWEEYLALVDIGGTMTDYEKITIFISCLKKRGSILGRKYPGEISSLSL
jgi:hypothetical protein